MAGSVLADTEASSRVWLPRCRAKERLASYLMAGRDRDRNRVRNQDPIWAGKALRGQLLDLDTALQDRGSCLRAMAPAKSRA